MLNIVRDSDNSFGKDSGEILLNQNNKQTLQENNVCILGSKDH